MTTITEPLSAAQAVNDYLRLKGFPNPDDQPHPTQGRCKKCDRELDRLWRQIDHPRAEGWFPVTCCDPCYDLVKRGSDREKANDEWWQERCPPEFRKDWDNRIGSPDLYREVMNYDPTKRRGLIIVGRSGSCKTRVIWHLLRRLTMDGVEWYFATALEVMEGLPADAYRKRVLVIDDLGNDPLTMAKEVTLLKVIRQRVDWHMPLIVTTQFKGRDIAARFSEGATAQAIVRRLREFCDPINVDEMEAKDAAKTEARR